MLFEALLAMKSAVPEGAKSMVVGMLPVATSPPLRVSRPVLRSILKDETDESPWVATNTAPVPEEDNELLLLQALKPTSKTGSTIPARNRNLVPILFFLPSPLSSFPTGRAPHTPVD